MSTDDGNALERRLGAIEAEMRAMQTDVNYLKGEISRLGKETDRISGTMSEVAQTLARIDGAMPHMASSAEVEQASHKATRGLYGSWAAAAVTVVALATRFWPASGQ